MKTESQVDLYAILNTTKMATNDQLRKNYFLLAKVFHPDKSRNDTNENIQTNINEFIKIEEAYKSLMNKATRIVYDNYGHRGLKTYFQFEEKFSKYEAILNSPCSKEIRNSAIRVSNSLT